MIDSTIEACVGILFDWDNWWVLEYTSGPHEDLTLGIWVEEIDALLPEHSNEILPIPGTFLKEDSYQCKMLCDIIHLESAEAVALYENNFYKGTPVITRNKYGKGIAYYLGSDAEQILIDELVGSVCSEKGNIRLAEVPEFIEVTCRSKGNVKHYFVINHLDEAIEVSLPFVGYKDLLTNQNIQDKELLKPFDVKVLVADSSR